MDSTIKKNHPAIEYYCGMMLKLASPFTEMMTETTYDSAILPVLS